jgi:arabinofuranosyltransferase
MTEEKRFWDNAAGQTAEWLVVHGKPGRIAIGDIGYVGYRTNYPVLDLLGLVDPVISQLPGGYTKKLGKGFKERFFDAKPEWAVIILSGGKCEHAVMKGSKLLFNDRRFKRHYELAHNVQVVSDAGWCIFKRKDF